MRYESPEMTALTSAINAIQSSIDKEAPSSLDSGVFNEGVGAYADWED
jgi:hypothetical protein